MEINLRNVLLKKEKITRIKTILSVSLYIKSPENKAMCGHLHTKHKRIVRLITVASLWSMPIQVIVGKN